MRPAGFETTIPASEQPQAHALDCAATGVGISHLYHLQVPYVDERLLLIVIIIVKGKVIPLQARCGPEGG